MKTEYVKEQAGAMQAGVAAVGEDPGEAFLEGERVGLPVTAVSGKVCGKHMKRTITPRSVELDTLLTLEEAAALWRLRPQEISARSKGRNAKIPGIWINSRVVRFHPRMMFAKAARDNGVPLEVIMAALNGRKSGLSAARD